MSNQSVKIYIEEKAQAFIESIREEIPLAEMLARFWAANPNDLKLYRDVYADQGVNTFPARLHNNFKAAAWVEGEDPDRVPQLALPGLEDVRCSPLVENPPGVWRKGSKVAMEDQVAHTRRTLEHGRRVTQYNAKKLEGQLGAVVSMEDTDPGSSKMPIEDVRARWQSLGLCDESEPSTPTVEPAATDAR